MLCMIGVVGINHKKASLDIREKFSISESELPAFSERIFQQTDVQEMVVLSTCNRTEIYYYHDKSCNNKSNKQIIEQLHQFKKVAEIDKRHFYLYAHVEAVKHLFRVISGMDSMVIGEDQVVKQVKNAYMTCTDLALTDAMLMRLFQMSFKTGKQVRSCTAIQQGATSVSYAAADVCEKEFNNLSEKRIMVVGSGETGRLAMLHLQKKGVKHFIATNRTFEKAVTLATEFKGVAIAFQEFRHYLPQCDIIITATGATNHLITRDEMAKAVISDGRRQPQVLIDLAVPRNIEKSVGSLDQVKLYGVDDLQSIIRDTEVARKETFSKAEIIIDKISDEYFEWVDSRALRPIIKAIAIQMEKINKDELNNFKPDLTEVEFAIIEKYGNHLAQRYIKSIVKNIVKMSENGKATHVLKSINQLFETETVKDDKSTRKHSYR